MRYKYHSYAKENTRHNRFGAARSMVFGLSCGHHRRNMCGSIYVQLIINKQLLAMFTEYELRLAINITIVFLHLLISMPLEKMMVIYL